MREAFKPAVITVKIEKSCYAPARRAASALIVCNRGQHVKNVVFLRRFVVATRLTDARAQ